MNYQRELYKLLQDNKYVNISPEAIISLEKYNNINIEKKEKRIAFGGTLYYYVIQHKVIIDVSNIDSNGCVIGTDYKVEYSTECESYYYFEEIIINWWKSELQRYEKLKKELECKITDEKIKNNHDIKFEALLNQKLKEIKK